MVLIRRTALEAIGGWPTANAWASDVEAWFTLSLFATMVLNARATAAYRIHHRRATSYQWRLSGSYDYFLNVRSTCERLLSECNRSRPEETDKRQRQYAILKPMADVIKAVTTQDPLLCRSALVLLESHLHASTGSDGVCARDLAINTLCWYLQPSLEPSDARQARSMIRTLFQSQPHHIHFVGRLLPFHPANDFPASALLDFLTTEPWQIRAWWLFARYRAMAPLANRIRRLMHSLATWP